MPYRSQKELRRWQRQNGWASLEIEAGRAFHPLKKKYMDLPLPFGPKARLILIHLNSEAIKTGTPVIDVEDSITAFIKHLLKRSPNGREIRHFKDQLSSLSTATIRLAILALDRAVQINTQIVTAFELWFLKNPNQRVLWPSTVRLSQEYFDTLVKHAVPLDERSIAALSHSPMALDVYVWLAQRLHRIDPGKPQFIPWQAVYQQFGQGFARIRKFREKFFWVLKQAQTQYLAARIEADRGGVTLRQSPPPVPKRFIAIDGGNLSD
ncbi:MAG: replication protein RepA [Thermodesulfobacteriota bacterium]